MVVFNELFSAFNPKNLNFPFANCILWYYTSIFMSIVKLLKMARLFSQKRAFYIVVHLKPHQASINIYLWKMYRKGQGLYKPIKKAAAGCSYPLKTVRREH